jgi:hypothetical protein
MLQIEPYPDFRDTLLRMKRDVNIERLKILSNNEAWLATTLSTSGEEYRVKTRMLQITFHSVFGSPLLDPPSASSQAATMGDGRPGSPLVPMPSLKR